MNAVETGTKSRDMNLFPKEKKEIPTAPLEEKGKRSVILDFL